MRIFGLLGQIRVEDYVVLVLVTAVEPVAHIRTDQVIYRIAEVTFEAVSPGAEVSFSATEPLQKLFTTGCYFSPNFDLTNAMQRGALQRAECLHLAADRRFYWNRDMYSEMLTAGMSPIWCLPMIQGFVGSVTERNLPEILTIVLISRRSCLMAGTRFHARGIDDSGDVGNFVETEQITLTSRVLFAHVQVRGSVPVFWQQSGMIKKEIQLSRSEDGTAPAFLKHFRTLCALYERLIVINLLSEKSQGESLLTDALTRMFKLHGDEFSSVVGRYHFDYKSECGHDHAVNIKRLLALVSEKFAYCGFFAVGDVKRRQKGVTRINCLDCLDRTNVVMARLGWEALSQEVETLGGHLAEDYDTIQSSRGLLREFKNLWADNGDMLSRQYTGVGSVSSSVTRNGRKGISGLLDHGVKTIGRFLNSARIDQQESIETVLGTGLRPNRRAGEPRTQVSIHVCTWNLGGQPPKRLAQLPDWLIDPEYEFVELLAVGFQEIVPLNARNVLQADNTQEALDRWNSAILSFLNAGRGMNYVHLSSVSLVGLGLSLFARRDLVEQHHISSVFSDSVKTGFKGTIGNKGGVAIRCEVYGTNVVVWNCHLASGLASLEARVSQLSDVHARAFQGQRKVPKIPQHDVKILIGDLNFRLILSNSDVRGYIDRGEIGELLQYDQLNLVKGETEVLKSYIEAEIRFKPTYKYDKNSDEYDTSKKMRVPAWCDRILCEGARVQGYRRCEIRYSDHRPVSGTVIIGEERVERRPEPDPRPVPEPVTGHMRSLSSKQSQFSDLLGLDS